MTQKKLATIGILIVLLVSTFGAVAAQGTLPPAEEPTPAPKFLNHPVVQLLAAYFGREAEEDTVVDPLAPPVEPTEPEVTPETIAEEIATYHEEGMGFGVLVKLYAMAEDSKLACEAEGADPECEPLLVDDLVTEFKSGVGMGAMFKDHGKPALLGVGQVKKALKNGEDAQDPATVTDQKGNKGNKPIKNNKPKNK